MGSTSVKSIFYFMLAFSCFVLVIDAIYGEEEKLLDKILGKMFKFYKVSDDKDKKEETEKADADSNTTNDNKVDVNKI